MTSSAWLRSPCLWITHNQNTNDQDTDHRTILLPSNRLIWHGPQLQQDHYQMQVQPCHGLHLRTTNAIKKELRSQHKQNLKNPIQRMILIHTKIWGRLLRSMSSPTLWRIAVMSSVKLRVSELRTSKENTASQKYFHRTWLLKVQVKMNDTTWM